MSPRACRASTRALPAILAASSLGFLALAAGCRDAGRADQPESVEDTLARERAAARFDRLDYHGARQELAPLVAGAAAAADDLLRAAAVEFALYEPERATALLDRAGKRADASPAARYLRGVIAYERGDVEAAERHLRAALELAPEDFATRLALASAVQERGRQDEAERIYRALVDIGIENGESWYLAALFRLQQMLRGLGRDEEAEPFVQRWTAHSDAGARVPGDAVLRLGRLGRLAAPEPSGGIAPPPAAPVRFERRALELPLLAGALEIAAHDFDGDLRMDVLARLPDGVAVALRGERGERGWRAERVYEGAVTLARAFDIDNDGDLDLLLFGEEGVLFLLQGEGGFRRAELARPALPSAPSDALAVDFDHDGDLDLLFVGSFGARLWRNDGAWVAGGAFVDVTAEAGLPMDRPFAWCAVEDFDGDNDVDLLLGGPDGLFLADNLRGGRFADRTERFGPAVRMAAKPLLADFGADGRPDVWVPGQPSTLWRQTREGGFQRVDTGIDVPVGAAAIDLDLDGSLDLVWDGGALLSAGLPSQRSVALEGWPEVVKGELACFADFDGDQVPDAFRVGAEGAELARGRGPAGHALRLRLLGAKDNRRAVGAVIELRAREIYRRVYYRGEQELIGVGPYERVDVLRVRWPNGLVQTALNRDLADQTDSFELDESLADFAQEQGLIGSCPFLYTWNGETFAFVTDVLGVTPLGLPIAPGVLVPFDHDEYVLVRGDQLVPREGFFELQITEELREVTYLDRVRLDVVDHPADTEIHPNERFTFPPFPEHEIHVLEGARAPVRATGSDGRDWSAALAAEDDVHAVPFTRQAPQFDGLAEPWFLELEFDREAAERAGLRLLLTGWFYWTDASVNVAAARHPGIDFVPPVLAVPDGEGGWREVGPPIGFPAGKTKTMVIDVSQLDLGRDPRLRVSTTLALYWDRIALASARDQREVRVTELEPLSAELWERGFSARIPAGRDDLPERFDWDLLAETPRWDQHVGFYTRLGECAPLLGAIDDRYVILGAGDALTIRFDATRLPPLAPGWTRDYLLFLDGWAKDGDPNTLAATTVEPLPFHGMSSYPYPSDERFPDGEEHRRWREEWNVRPARRWIEPLASGEPAEPASALAGSR